MMDVCQHQNLTSDNGSSEVQSIQQCSPNPQASTSFTTVDQQNLSPRVTPAWQSHQEHPLILGITSAVSDCLSFHENSNKPNQQVIVNSEAQQLSLHPACSVQQALSCTGDVEPVKKGKDSDASQGDDR